MSDMDWIYSDVLISAAELIKDRFFFISLCNENRPKSTTCTHYFSIDTELCYERFFNDFGPLNISMLYHYCTKVNKKLNSAALQKKRIIHYTSLDDQKRVNAAYLAASYMIIYFNYSPERVTELLSINNSKSFIDFCDASMGIAFTISLQDCLSAIYKAHTFGMFNFEDFDFLDYEHYERVENGDLNWIVPGKLIGFCGPQNRSSIDNGYPLHSPETYFSYFRRHKVTTVVRLNEEMYDASKFTKGGFEHKDLYFIDGSTPSDKILNMFLSICENSAGAVAVHCKAGLGRTGSLIGSYIMKHNGFTASETIAWVRICRPGSIIGHQQTWLQSKQVMLWEAGDKYRAKLNSNAPNKYSRGIYSYSPGTEDQKMFLKKKGDVSGILEQVDTMYLEDQDLMEENILSKLRTQGDKLKQIKSRQHFPESHEKVMHARVLVTPLDNPCILRSSRIIGRRIKNSATSSLRKSPKRDGAKDMGSCLHKTKIAKTARGPSTAATSRGQLKGTKVKGNAFSKGIVHYKLESPICTDSKVIKYIKQPFAQEKEKIALRSVKILKRSHLRSYTESKYKYPSNLHCVSTNTKC